MTSSTASDLVIRIDCVDQLFNAPDANPFSDKPAVVLGEPALLYAVRQGLGRGLRDWRGRRLIILLPPDQVTLGLQPQVADAIRRLAAVKRADNEVVMRISRWRSLIGLVIAIGVAAVLCILLVIVTNTLLASASDALLGAVAGIVTIFIWATVWNPWDRLIYEWVEPYLENRILNSIATMEILVQADTRAPGAA